MIKADLQDLLHKQVGLSKIGAQEAIETILEIIKKALEEGEKVQITGFGVFSRQEKKERIGRDPKTGNPISIPSHWVLNFKPSRSLKQKINPYNDTTHTG
jgi:nucleoid DNA-binding protein